MDEEKYIIAYMGNNYIKLSDSKFSICSFLFGSLYWAYRKLVIQSLIACFFELLLPIVLLFVTSFPVSIIISVLSILLIKIVEGFVFRKMYRASCIANIKRIIEKNVSDTEAEEIRICQKKGGTSIGYLFFLIIFSSVLASGITMAFGNIIERKYDDYLNQVESGSNKSIEVSTESGDTIDGNTNNVNSNLLNADSNLQVEDVSAQSDNQAGESDGDISYSVKTDVKLSDYIEISIPEIFKIVSSNQYSYDYYYGDTKMDPQITAKVVQINAESAESFIKGIVKTTNLSEENDMYSVELNGLKWFIVGYMTDTKIVYYNSFDKNGRVFLYRYDIDNTITDENLLVTYDNIIYSIKSLDNTPVTENTNQETTQSQQADNNNTLTNSENIQNNNEAQVSDNNTPVVENTATPENTTTPVQQNTTATDNNNNTNSQQTTTPDSNSNTQINPLPETNTSNQTDTTSTNNVQQQGTVLTNNLQNQPTEENVQ